MWYSNIDLINLKRKFNIDYKAIESILDSFCHTEVLVSIKDEKEFDIIFSEKIEILKEMAEQSRILRDLHMKSQYKFLRMENEFRKLEKELQEKK